MLICGVVLGIGSLFFLLAGRKKKKRFQKNAGILCIAALIGLLAGYSEQEDPLLKEGSYLLRPENGTGDLETELLLKLEGVIEQKDMDSNGKELTMEILIPEQHLTKAEEQEYLQNAIQEIEETFPGENVSVNEICSNVIVLETYQNGKVEAEWDFSNYRLIDLNGKIAEEELPEEGETVKAVVSLKCEDSEAEYEFYFYVFPKKLETEEMLEAKIRKKIEETGQAEGEEKLILPKEIDGLQLNWAEKKSKTPEKILFLGMILIVFLPMVEESRINEKKKKREEALLLEYPDMVSKLMLLLGAGMTLSGAWNRIAAMYLEARKENTVPVQPVYEEMLITSREIESGVGEGKAYEGFGIRCRIPKYRKLSSLLSQNLKKGSQALSTLLEAEAGDVWEERKSMAQKYGEEAGTKLLIPMMMMFGIVLLIIMVPAVISFQM